MPFIRNSRPFYAFLVAFSLLSPAWALTPGTAAPAIDLPGRSGAVSLDAYRNKVVYLDFWASWCGPCKHSFPWMNAMQAKYGARGFQVVSINLDANTADGRRFLQEVPAHFVVAFDADGKTPRQYQVHGMPTSLIIGRDGRIVAEHLGFNERDTAALEQQIQAALGSRP
ncbi:MAG: TlpA family protein disulfide reductase [Betaproteobacteria bacterium]|nr:TlpA family protein disulfide reductase [Betaproteobacteria bacterium]